MSALGFWEGFGFGVGVVVGLVIVIQWAIQKNPKTCTHDTVQKKRGRPFWCLDCGVDL